MNQIEEFADERQKAWCVHCGEWIASLQISRDHVPSKGLFAEASPQEPSRSSGLQVVQHRLLAGRGDEEYMVAFLGSVIAGSSDPDRQGNANAARILRRNPKLRARIEGSRLEYRTLGGETRVVWKPEAGRIDRVILKNARGHAFFEIGEPILDQPIYVRSAPLEALTPDQRAAFENMDFGWGWPEVGSRMMTRMLTGQDLADGWIVVQEGIYRYAVAQTGGMLVRSVLFEYLATEVCWED